MPRPAAWRGRLVDVTGKCGDSAEEATLRGRPHEFGQLPNLVVPEDFDEPLPEEEYVVWAGTDGEQDDGRTTEIT